jgi:hypothetical protein
MPRRFLENSHHSLNKKQKAQQKLRGTQLFPVWYGSMSRRRHVLRRYVKFAQSGKEHTRIKAKGSAPRSTGQGQVWTTTMTSLSSQCLVTSCCFSLIQENGILKTSFIHSNSNSTPFQTYLFLLQLGAQLLEHLLCASQKHVRVFLEKHRVLRARVARRDGALVYDDLQECQGIMS